MPEKPIVLEDWEPVFIMGGFYWVDAEGNIVRPMTIEEIEEVADEWARE